VIIINIKVALVLNMCISRFQHQLKIHFSFIIPLDENPALVHALWASLGKIH